jgi:hypothetical protein
MSTFQLQPQQSFAWENQASVGLVPELPPKDLLLQLQLFPFNPKTKDAEKHK